MGQRERASVRQRTTRGETGYVNILDGMDRQKVEDPWCIEGLPHRQVEVQSSSHCERPGDRLAMLVKAEFVTFWVLHRDEPRLHRRVVGLDSIGPGGTE
ncbi:hypothetical protein GCM10009611_03820 [Arthrobacter roseus]